MGTSKKAITIAASLALFLALQRGGAEARWMVHDTEFVSIWYKDQNALETLFKRLYLNSVGRSFLYLFGNSKYSEKKLNEEIDGLLKRVGTLLGMDIEGVEVRMKVYTESRSMNAEVFPFSNRKIETAFYVPARKTIYVSLNTVTSNILAHELTHALLHHYFDKPVPSPTQEILSRYIDLNIHSTASSQEATPQPNLHTARTTY